MRGERLDRKSEGDGLQLGSVEAFVLAAEAGSRSSLSKQLDARRPPLPARLVAGFNFPLHSHSHSLNAAVFTLSRFRVISQGVLVSASDDDADGRPLLLDDGTGLIELSLTGEFRHRAWKLGMYVMVVGGYVERAGELPMIKIHKIVDLSSSPDREAMWYLEVMEAYKLFYQPLVEEFT
ncbi:recQ-mediated instability protein 2 [Spatholobus suberectus]|nr:recQ-mediated instability protein 2 [Spatholobus suberectus]